MPAAGVWSGVMKLKRETVERENDVRLRILRYVTIEKNSVI